MKKVYLCAIFLVFVNQARATEQNPYFTYSEECIATAVSVSSSKNVQSIDAQNVELDHQLGLLLNEKEDADFRLMVMDTVEITRQSLAYDLEAIKKADKGVFEKLNKACAIKNISTEISESFPDLFGKLLDMADGVDSGG